VVSNTASASGGGTERGYIYNCTVVGNSAADGGGAHYGGLANCIFYYNLAPTNANVSADTYYTGLAHCCTTPLQNGNGIFSSAPLFVNLAGGDFHLQTNSPCINAGINNFAAGPTDFEGNPRISSGTVDVGAYEFQYSPSLMPYAWLQQYGLATDGSADFLDTDGDGANNWQEWVAGTSPTSAASVFKVSTPSRTGSNVTITWSSVFNHTYSVQRATDLGAVNPFTVLRTNIAGLTGTTSFTDTNAPASGPAYYRVGVQ
jgi:hypothetical protein